MSTTTRSSTTSQPTAIRPLSDCSKPRDSSARSRTTVLATDREIPKTSPAPQLAPTRAPRRPEDCCAPIDLHHCAGDGDPADRHQVLE